MRAMEKKLFRRVVISVAFIATSIVLFIFFGLPLVVSLILAFTSFQKHAPDEQIQAQQVLLPPVVNPSFEATNSARVTLTGFGQKDAKIILLVNDREQVNATVEEDGSFIAQKVVLMEGENKIQAVSRLGDISSSPSSALIIVYKNTPPRLDVTSPSGNEDVSGENPVYAITGDTDPGNRVYVNERLVIVNPQGHFSHPVSLDPGENVFLLKATDIAGNEQELERRITYYP